MRVDVTTYYLEMTAARALRPKRLVHHEVDIKQVQVPSPEFNRFFYTAVGGDWYWLDRLPWTYGQWREWVEQPTVETWVAYVTGTPAGYCELEAQAGGNVELAYFGLLPQFIGMGLGSHLLTAAIERAWHMDAARVWVHTCTLDHPGALANYRARGFRVFREETHTQELPEHSPGPWPGAQRQERSR
jgi:GNAT superfamily N-acetyltransferase